MDPRESCTPRSKSRVLMKQAEYGCGLRRTKTEMITRAAPTLMVSPNIKDEARIIGVFLFLISQRVQMKHTTRASDATAVSAVTTSEAGETISGGGKAGGTSLVLPMKMIFETRLRPPDTGS